MTRIDFATIVPGGIRESDHIHRTTNDGTCSRCRKEIDEDDGPLHVWLPPDFDDMLTYCCACIGWGS